MTLTNMLSMWFCGDISKNIPPYRMLRCKDMKQLNGGKQKLSNMKTLVKHVLIAAVIANWNDLVVDYWYPRNVIDLYVGVIYFLDFPCIAYEKRRRYDTMSLNTCFNVFMKRKGNCLEINDGSVLLWNGLYSRGKYLSQ